MGGRGGNVHVGEGVRMQTHRHKACDVRNIGHCDGSYLISNGANTLKIKDTGISGGTTYNQFWFMLKRQLLNLVVINLFRFPI